MQFSFIEGNITKQGVKLQASEKSNSRVATFKLAVQTGGGKYKRKDYFQCVCFGKTAENISKYFHAHSLIQLYGTMQNNPFRKTADGYDIPNWQFIIDKFEFPPFNKPNGESDSGEDGGDFSYSDNESNEFTLIEDDSDSLPF